MQPVRGTKDLLFGDHRRFQLVVDVAKAVGLRFGFEEISTPILERASLFQHTSGETSDIVLKEMFEVISRGEREGDRASGVVLRPEGTAPFMRALLHQGLHQSLPVKAFYNGPMFRYDRPQKGRQRQFHQIGVEWVGDPDPMSDVETIACGLEILTQLGLDQAVTLRLNTLGDGDSRSQHRAHLVAYFKQHARHLSPESVERLEINPLRILDSKHPDDQAMIKEAPRILDHLTGEADTFFSKVCQGLDSLEVAYEVDSTLVRGLDYYSHTAFEWVTSDLGAQQTVLAGGRYDGLSTLLGGPPLAGVGWAAGIERLVLLKEAMGGFVSSDSCKKVALIPVGDACVVAALTLAQALRQREVRVEALWGSSTLGKKLKQADKRGFATALILGEEELAQKTILVKDLTTGTQHHQPQQALLDATSALLNPA